MDAITHLLKDLQNNNLTTWNFLDSEDRMVLAMLNNPEQLIWYCKYDVN